MQKLELHKAKLDYRFKWCLAILSGSYCDEQVEGFNQSEVKFCDVLCCDVQ